MIAVRCRFAWHNGPSLYITAFTLHYTMTFPKSDEANVTASLAAKEYAMNGLENRTAVNWLQGELEWNRWSENVQFKYYSGKMHAKGPCIDDRLLTIGDLNFHWSLSGLPSLAEDHL